MIPVQFNQLYFYTSTILKWKTLIKDFQLEPLILSSLSYLHSKKCIKVYGFVIMPNHLHMIWELLCNNGKESPAISFRKYTAHKFEDVLRKMAPEKLKEFAVEKVGRNYNFWQSKADWYFLNQNKTIEQKLNYIHLNPMRKKWQLVKDPCNYYYSSARFYETGFNSFDFLYDYRDWIDLSVVVNK
jgi:putative transposase